jgi:hypothetical protein
VKTLTNSCGANQAQDFFEVTNTGTTSIRLSDISIKFWVDDTSGQKVVPHVWTGGCVTGVNGNPSCVHQVSGVNPSATPFAPGCGSDSTHQANWEITISTSDSTMLPPGATWSNIQSALNLANYTNFSPGTSDWYSPCLPGSAYVADSHFAVYFQGSLVFSNGINAPDCRAPQGQQTLSGYVPPAIATAPVVGPVPPSTVLTLAVGVPTQSSSGMPSLVRQLSDPTSPSYRQYLTQDQILAQFGPSASDYQAVINWAQSVGFTVTATYPNRLLVDVTATAAQVEQALFANLVFRLRPDGSQFFSLERDPSLCATGIPILRISGLDTRVVPTLAGGTGPAGFYDSKDFRAAYASCSNSTGKSQSVGLLEFDGFTPSDITLYECATGLAVCNPAGQIISGNVPNVVVKTLDGFSGSPGSGAVEVTADISFAVAMAPGLSNVTVFEAPGDGSTAHSNDILSNMESQPSIKQHSSSWLFNFDDNTQRILYEMAMQGQSFFQGSGDTGSQSWSGDPGDIRDEDGVTVVGGTTLTMGGTPNAYVSETTWNLATQGASGGGFANGAVIPFYQQPFNVAAAGQPEFRQLPDVSMVATSAYIVFGGVTGGLFFAGTSDSAPLWAGYMALANDQASSLNIQPVGFANPFLYAVAGTSSAVYKGSFNDINDGSTSNGSGSPSTWVPATTGPFTAGPGYDLATGLGTPKCQLLNELGSGAIGLPPPPTPDGGAGGGADGGVTPPTPSVNVTATFDAGGVEICIFGSGFPVGDTFDLEYTRLPDVIGGALSTSDGFITVAADGSFALFDDTFSQATSNGPPAPDGFPPILGAICSSGNAGLIQLTDTSKPGSTPFTAPFGPEIFCNLVLTDTQTGPCPLAPEP